MYRRELYELEKATLTKEQAHEFESFKALRSSLEEWARDKYDPNAPHSIIHKLTFDKMARAFLVGYEIEKSYELGDEVIDITSRNCPIITVTNQDAKHLYGYWGDDVRTCVQKQNARLATAEEVYWKKTLGREEIADFREGDLIKNDFGYFLEVKSFTNVGHFVSFKEAREMWEMNNFQGILPVESFKPFPAEVSTE